MWAPQPGPQTDAITATWCPEILYGGAAGGGKSDYLLGDYLQDVPTYGKAWSGVLFRRSYPELEELIKRSHDLYPSTGAEWREQKKEWQWPNGAILKMRYLERDRDATRYQGHQYAWIGWDELTQWPTLYAYRYLRARLRSAEGVQTKRIRAAANPGGAGHQEVKAYFIDPAPGGFVPTVDVETGLERMFIPARLSDNRILVANDPEYENRLRGLGSAELVRAWLEGDWSVVEGAFFDCWESKRHVLRPFAIPSDWVRFRSADWGFAAPFSVGWWAVASDDYRAENAYGEPIVIPRGAMVRYREWYGASAPNVGLRLTAEQVAKGIKGHEEGERITGGVLDPAAFAEDGGPSIAERMRREGVHFRPADNRRVGQRGAMGGWDQVRSRLVGDDDERPMMFVFSTCVDTIRTLPVLQHDRSRPEDLDTSAEDHAADDVRYAAMSRPWVRATAKPAKPVDRWRRAHANRAQGTETWKTV